MLYNCFSQETVPEEIKIAADGIGYLYEKIRQEGDFSWKWVPVDYGCDIDK